jgi:hypothetical protein
MQLAYTCPSLCTSFQVLITLSVEIRFQESSNVNDEMQNGDHNHSITLAVIPDSEKNVTCIIMQYKKDWIVTRWFDTILKMMKPQEEQFFINPSICGARDSSNMTTLPKFQRHQQSGRH